MPGELGALWYDDEAGPMVRPYTVTRGRTRSGDGLPEIDLIGIVSVVDEADTCGHDAGEESEGGESAAPDRPSAPSSSDSLDDEHLCLLDRCRAAGPLSVAELAAGADLALGVVRVLLGDLLDAGRVRITRPVPPAELPDVGLLHHVITGLKSL